VDADTRIAIIDRVIATAVFIPDYSDGVVVPVGRNRLNDGEINSIEPEVRTDAIPRSVPAYMAPIEGVVATPVSFKEVVVKTATVPVMLKFAARFVAVVIAFTGIALVELLFGSRVFMLYTAPTVVVLRLWLALNVPTVVVITATLTTSAVPVLLGECRHGEQQNAQYQAK